LLLLLRLRLLLFFLGYLANLSLKTQKTSNTDQDTQGTSMHFSFHGPQSAPSQTSMTGRAWWIRQQEKQRSLSFQSKGSLATLTALSLSRSGENISRPDLYLPPPPSLPAIPASKSFPLNLAESFQESKEPEETIGSLSLSLISANIRFCEAFALLVNGAFDLTAAYRKKQFDFIHLEVFLILFLSTVHCQ